MFNLSRNITKSQFAKKILTTGLAITLSTTPAFANQCLTQFSNPQEPIRDLATGQEFFFNWNVSAPARDDLPTFVHYPGNAYLTGSLNANILNSSTTQADKFLFLWANHCRKHCRGLMGRPNLPRFEVSGVNERDTGFRFRTARKANACTLAQLFNHMGADVAASNMLDQNGLTPINFDLKSPPAGTPSEYTDTCYLYNVDVRDNIVGVVVDYEVADDRTTQETDWIMNRLNSYLKRADINKELWLWTNTPRPAPPAVQSSWNHSGFVGGINGNAPGVLALVDRVSIQFYDDTMQRFSENGTKTVAQVLREQALQYFSSTADYNKFANRKKVYVVAGLGNLAQNEAKEVRDFVVDQKLHSIAIWRNGARLDQSSCTSNNYQNLENLMCGSGNPANCIKP